VQKEEPYSDKTVGRVDRDGRGQGESMRVRPAVIAFVVGIFCSGAVLADDSYLCVGALATGFGFHYEKNAWEVDRFPPTKLIVKRADSLIVEWRVYDFEKNVPIASCRGDFDREGFLRCDGVAQFMMSRVTKRFLYIYTLGYWSDSENYPAYKEGTNRPWMEIGKCSRL